MAIKLDEVQLQQDGKFFMHVVDESTGDLVTVIHDPVNPVQVAKDEIVRQLAELKKRRESFGTVKATLETMVASIDAKAIEAKAVE